MKHFLFVIISIIKINLLFSQELSNELIWNTRTFQMKYIEGFNSMEDGIHFSKLTIKNDSLYITKHKFSDYKGEGENIANLSRFKSVFDEKTIDGYQFNKGESKLLLTTSSNSIYRRSYEAIFYLFDIKSKTIEPLSTEYFPQTLVEYSPDGKKVSFIYKNNIFIKDLETKEISQITVDGKKNAIINGTTDWVYEEEFAITKAYYWSPDSKYIAFLKFDESNVKEVTMPLYKGLYPENETFKYPKAGEDNSIVTLHYFEINSKLVNEIKLKEYEYIPRLKWLTSENTLIVQTLNRHQNELNFHKINFNDNLESKVFYTEKSETYIEIDDNLEILSNNELVLSSEKDGFKHLYRLDLNGQTHQITKGNWDVIDFYGVNEKDRMVYYSSSENGAINKSIFKISLNGKNKKQISTTNGYSDAEFSTGMNYFIKTYSTANTPNQYTLCNNQGVELFKIEDNNKLSTTLKNYHLSPKEFFKIKGETDSLNASIIKPFNFDPTKKYPVYVHVYGGPGNNTVLNKYKGQDYLFHQLLAQKGYIVLSIDPRGTMYRGAQFKKSTYLKLGKLELEDVLAATKNLYRENNYVDSNRIGIQGWSFGGYLSSLAMTKGNELFKVGIAVAPVTNWRYYDNIYTERYMRTPQENESGYDLNSPINFAKDLKGKYLLIHGAADDNVHLQNTMELIEKLVQSNKNFDAFIYPNKNHGIYGGNTRNHLFNMILNFTLNNL